jgi:lactoylglutathione lyase
MYAPASVGVAQSFLKIFVADLERSSAFYAAALGLTLGARMAAPMFDEVILRPPGGEPGGSLVLCRWRDERPLELGNARGPIGFSVVDVDAAYGRVLAAGGESRLAPRSLGPARLAFVVDPDGHELELLDLGGGEVASR